MTKDKDSEGSSAVVDHDGGFGVVKVAASSGAGPECPTLGCGAGRFYFITYSHRRRGEEKFYYDNKVLRDRTPAQWALDCSRAYDSETYHVVYAEKITEAEYEHHQRAW